ncbi:LysM peptidoglycan-binding domain-containing protein [Lacticaseibacillus nasuensis]|uniref:LysM peptidoglycan-binding domain-containing protein n=1 Tax=Lacticaseibacillus nasuensis TaxID=944671 RepID=UPI000AC9A45A|nr:LysM peptidoglycan-binding domain-containing protein [Lacticaseibacillus nasuensis]
MNQSRKQRRLERAMEEQTHRAKLVHSKHRGWLAVGMIATMGLTGLFFTNTQSVSAAETTSTKQWTQRSVSDIEAQINASDKKVYDIKWGDTLSTITEALNNVGISTTMNRLAEINHIANIDLIYAGNKLYLYGTGADATVTVKGADGSYQTYNLNPAKPVTPSAGVAAATQSAAAQTATEATQTPTTTTASSTSATATKSTSKQSAAALKKAKAQAESEKKAAAAAKAQAEAAKKAAAAKEAELTALLNGENTDAASTLTTKRDAALTKVANTQATLTAAQGKFDTAQTAASNAATAKQQADAAVTAKQAEITSAQTGIKAASDKIAATQAKLDALKADADKEKDADATQQIATLTQQLATAKQNLAAYQTKLTNAQTALDTAKSTAADAATKLATASTALATATKERDAAATNLKSAKTDLSALPSTVTAPNSAAAKKIKAQLADINTEIDQLNAEIAKYDKQIAAWDQQLEDIAQQLSDGTSAENQAKTAAEAIDTTDDDATVSAANDAAKHAEDSAPKVKHTPVAVEKDATVNVDESGQTLTNTEGYTKVATSAPKDVVTTADNGDTVTTHTTTVTWHKNVTTKKNVTVNVDESGQSLTDTTGYTKVKTSAPVTTSEQAANGDITETTTTTVTWHKNGTTTKNVTVNVDDTGKTLTNTTGYTKVATSDPIPSDEISANGDKITTYTTTVTWHKPTVTTNTKTINVDEQGNTLSSTTGYKQVKTGTPAVATKTAINGDTVKTVTTTVTWHKIATKTVNVSVNVDEQGNRLTSTDGYTKVTTAPKTTTSTATNGDITKTITTTTTWKKTPKVVTTTKVAVTKNVDEAGNDLGQDPDTTAYHLMKTSDPVVTKSTDANGNITETTTTTNTYHKIVVKHTSTIQNVDATDVNAELKSTDGYTLVDSTTFDMNPVVAENGDTTIETVTMNTWTKTANQLPGVNLSSDKKVQEVKAQVEDGVGVTIPQALDLTNLDLSKLVAKKFNAMLNEEQANTGHAQTQVVADDTSMVRSEQRAIEALYDFSHDQPEGSVPGGNYNDYAAAGVKASADSMSANAECICYFTLNPATALTDEDTLATQIAKQAFKQYIEDERATNGGHYDSLVNSGFTRLSMGVYVVNGADGTGLLKVATQVNAGEPETIDLSDTTVIDTSDMNW